MPQGCGTWPAVWETKGSNWPNGGEVDILEGANDRSPNQVTLHTSPGCTMPAQRSMTGTAVKNDCNALISNNEGCGVHVRGTNSYGPEFNRNGGGWYAIERRSDFIKVWFWARNDGSVPSAVRNGSGNVNTDSWGSPAAFFPNWQCDLNSKFQENNIIINLTLCGDWAGSTFGQARCPGSCTDYVNNNPSAFTNAYFNFAAIRVYT
ncbi:hypothetical protein HGRIS_000075 [Hohenbuehelia grisea]|uniref:GH16 domain-containing protein n=1 Tax=Hohenbuehelia grisea TaxID=104357 RepID=A0ABR3JQL2_9AGAR